MVVCVSDKSRAQRPKVYSYSEAAKLRAEKLEAAKHAYTNLLQRIITVSIIVTPTMVAA